MKLTKEDILKFGTKEEVKFLFETWRGTLQGEYNDFDEFKQYDEIYNLSKRLGFNNAEEAWEANPLVQGGVNPEDYKKVDKVVKDFHRSDKCDRCGEKISQREYKKNGSLCDMCEEDIALGRDKE